MSLATAGDRSEAFRRPLGIGIIIAAGVLMGLVEILHIHEMTSSLGVLIFALLPFIIDVALLGTGIVVWRSSFDGNAVLRIAAWVVLGMLVIGLLATWTITHQNVRGRPFAHAHFVTVNNLSVGGLIGFVFGWYDVHRLRHRQAAETERTRLEFLYSSLRHNVLNSINVILGHAELLHEGSGASDDTHITTIRDRSNELARFTEATKALMENFLGHSADTKQPVALSGVLREEVARHRQEYPHTEWSVAVEDDIVVEADDLLSELLSNILTNAVLHNDKSTPEVSITGQQRDGFATVTVADNGPGIPATRKDRVREWNVKGVDSPGSGLGLAIADTLANRYGGELRIEDNDPEGTVVTIELPTATMDDLESAER